MSEIFSSRLREARGKRSQAEVCAAIGVKQGTYSTWELGKYEPSFEVLVKIASYLDVSTDFLLGKSDSNSLSKLESVKVAINSIQAILNELKTYT